ncbi:DUF7503 family protein [Haloprofundus halobius]|nr:hypothetical protein [Haloprofundus halobius]
MSEHNPVAEFLADHPRMSGALFMICLLLSQAGAVAAGAVAAGNGTTVG